MDQRAVSDLFDRHHLALFRYAYRYTRRPDLAEDIVQEVFLRVVRGRDSYNERQRETAWLFTIAHRLLVDRSRALARHPIGPLPPTEPSAPQSLETSVLLNEAGVACLNGAAFGKYGEGFIRFSYANSYENLMEAVKRIESVLATTGATRR